LGRGIDKVFSLVQGPVSNAGNGVKSGLKGIFQFRSILKENEELKNQITELNRQLIQAKLTDTELAELRSLSNALGYDNVTPNYNYVTADVVAMDGSTGSISSPLTPVLTTGFIRMPWLSTATD
jgi:rod shape-determining protein MreC